MGVVLDLEFTSFIIRTWYKLKALKLVASMPSYIGVQGKYFRSRPTYSRNYERQLCITSSSSVFIFLQRSR